MKRVLLHVTPELSLTVLQTKPAAAYQNQNSIWIRRDKSVPNREQQGESLGGHETAREHCHRACQRDSECLSKGLLRLLINRMKPIQVYRIWDHLDAIARDAAGPQLVGNGRRDSDEALGSPEQEISQAHREVDRESIVTQAEARESGIKETTGEFTEAIRLEHAGLAEDEPREHR